MAARRRRERARHACLANQYAQVIERRSPLERYSQVYWITRAPTGPSPRWWTRSRRTSTTTSSAWPTSFTWTRRASRRRCRTRSADCRPVLTQIETASRGQRRHRHQQVQSVFNVIKAGNTIPVFTVNITRPTSSRTSTSRTRATTRPSSQTSSSSPADDRTLVSRRSPASTPRPSRRSGTSSSSRSMPLRCRRWPAPACRFRSWPASSSSSTRPRSRCSPGTPTSWPTSQYYAATESLDGLAGTALETRLAGRPVHGRERGAAGGRPAASPSRCGRAPRRTARAAPDEARRRRDAAGRRGTTVHRPPGREPGGGPRRSIPETETFDFHFALGHLPGVEQFDLRAGGGEAIPLTGTHGDPDRACRAQPGARPAR